MIDLSILVCSVTNRHNTFLPKILQQLHEQHEQLSDENKERVELLVLIDNKTIMLGAKRNHMVDLAQGKYIVFVDDDDRIASDYIKTLLDATAQDTDVIVFTADVSLNNAPSKPCYYSKDNKRDYNTADAYYRIPNHICCVKKEVAQKSSFPNIKYGEDSGYSKILLPHLKTEQKIDRVLYYYDYNVETTETQNWRKNVLKQRKEKPLVDVIILSKALTMQDRIMTQRTINSCYNGTNALPINIIVLEQGRARYNNAAEVIYKPGQFNYNAFANYGAEQGTADWIMIANNDLVFHDGWLHTLLAADHPIVSPKEPTDIRQKDITENTLGFETGKHFSGWCFMIKRKLWEQINKFDDCVDFWCSDDVVIEQVKAKGITPMLVVDSTVQHLGSKTFNQETSTKRQDMMWRNIYIFNQKYGEHRLSNNPQYKLWKEGNIT